MFAFSLDSDLINFNKGYETISICLLDERNLQNKTQTQVLIKFYIISNKLRIIEYCTLSKFKYLMYLMKFFQSIY